MAFPGKRGGDPFLRRMGPGQKQKKLWKLFICYWPCSCNTEIQNGLILVPNIPSELIKRLILDYIDLGEFAWSDPRSQLSLEFWTHLGSTSGEDTLEKGILE